MTVADAKLVQREILLRAMFPTMPVSAQIRFVELLEDVQYEAGATLFELGEAPDRFWFLVEGRVAMECEGERPWEFAPLALVGIIDGILQRPRTRSCRALEPSRAMFLRMTDWFDMLEDNAQIARAAIRNFATPLHARWRALAQLLPQRSEPPPGILPSELDTYAKILALRQAGFLAQAGMQAIVSLANVAETITLRKGETLFEVSAHEENLFIVARGLVELTQGSDFRYCHDAGDLIGGAAALCRALPNYSARAASDAIVLRIAEQDFYDQAEEHARLTRGTLIYLVSQLEPLLRLEPVPLGITPRT